MGSEIDLSTITVVDADGNAIEDYGSVTLQVMDENNNFDGTHAYTWLGYEPAWEDEEGNQVSLGDVTIKHGNAMLVVNSYGEGASFRVAGEVDLINLNKIDNAAFVLWGNATPVAIDLAKVIPEDADGVALEDYGAVTLQAMDETNSFDGTAAYTWLGYEPAWEDIDGNVVEVGDVTIAPGEAYLVVNSLGDVFYMHVPSPLSK